jgi:hypothetical protein
MPTRYDDRFAHYTDSIQPQNQKDSTMPTYTVLVRYRTNSGINAKTLEISAENMEAAITIATNRVRRQRGVIRIDGGDCKA